MRYAALEIGRRLTARRQLADRDHIFQLELPEAVGALDSGADQHALVNRRQGERAWVIGHPGPASYGRDPGPPPSFAAFPAPARFINEGMLWALDQILAADHHHPPAAGAALTGIGASAGTYTGPARIIKDETEFGKLRPGDVLVCPITSPVWSVLFGVVGALVTNTGGILSHSAIIAREHRIPAVLDTGSATTILRDGQTVTVDGTAGTVTVAESATTPGD
jgi:pyruvate,water dikinase